MLQQIIVTSAIVALNFLTFQMLLWLTHTLFKISFIFHFIFLVTCFHLILLSILPSGSHLLFSSSFFLFSHLCFFPLCLPSLCFPFPSQYFFISSFLVFHLLSLFLSLPLNYFLFLSTQYVNKTFDHSNIFSLYSSGF